MPNRTPSRRRAFIFARLSTEIRTRGGLRDTDMNAFAVMPCTWSPACVVTIVTPVANMPRVRRKATAGSSPSSPAISSSSSSGTSSNGDSAISGAPVTTPPETGSSNSPGSVPSAATGLAPGKRRVAHRMEPTLRVSGVPERLEQRLRFAHQLLRHERTDPDHLVAVVRVGHHVHVLVEHVEHRKAVGRERTDPPRWGLVVQGSLPFEPLVAVHEGRRPHPLEVVTDHVVLRCRAVRVHRH